jgi:hypothetical protein
MSTTATTSAAVITEPEAGPQSLFITLLDDSIIELPCRNWNADFLVESIFRRGHFKAADGIYYSASQIKKIIAK